MTREELLSIHICTQIPLPPELRAEAIRRAIQENPANGHAHAQAAAAAGVASADELPPQVFLALPTGKMWANGRTLRVQLLDGASPYVQSKVQQHAAVWQKYANINLQFVTSGPSEIRVAFTPGGSGSNLGTDCLLIPADQPTMNFGWFNDDTDDEEFSRTVGHEFGHALGCIHEHQSPAANIPWNRQAVYDYYETTYGWTQAQVDVNIFQLYSATTTQFSEFDVLSIMLYAIPASLTTNGFFTKSNTHLSETDKRFITLVYPPSGPDTGSFNTMEVRPW